MKINCHKDQSHLLQWHDHFAWRPVEIHKNECRWLETVERRWGQLRPNSEVWRWEYRAKEKQNR